MGKFILYGLFLVGVSSLINWTTLGTSAGASYGGYGGTRGGGIGGGGGWSSSGSGHK